MRERRLNEWPEWPLNPVSILSALERHDVAYVVIGGVAAIAHGSPLPTYDLDITPERSKKNLRALLDALAEMNGLTLPDEEEDATPGDAEELLFAETDISFFTPSGYIDVVFVPSGTRGYGELAARAERMEVGEGVSSTIAALRDVIRSKQALGRERDLAQLPALITLLEMQRSLAPQR